MKQTVKDELLSLLRCELCGQEVPSASYTPEEFKVLIRMAREQAVSALVAECLMKHNVKVNDDGAMEIMAILVSHQRHAAQIDGHVATLATLLNTHHIPYAVFKGQVAARYYDRPYLRSTGDVDFYVPPAYYEQAKEVVGREMGVTIADDYLDKHCEFTFGGTRFEMHHRVETFGSARHQRSFDALTLSDVTAHRASTQTIGGAQVAVFSPLVDVLVIFKHLFNHLLVEGVGLRQVCDLMLMLRRYRGAYSVSELAAALHQIGYYNAFLAMGALMVRHLGMAEADFPLAIPAKYHLWGDRIKDEILSGGNFGKYGRTYRHPGKLKSLETASMALRHCLWLMSLAPADILCLIPKRIRISFSKYV